MDPSLTMPRDWMWKADRFRLWRHLQQEIARKDLRPDNQNPESKARFVQQPR